MKAPDLHRELAGCSSVGALKLPETRIHKRAPLIEPAPEAGGLIDIAGRAALNVLLLGESPGYLQARSPDFSR